MPTLTPAEVQAYVAMSLLRLGSDTRAARLFTDVIWPEISGRPPGNPGQLVGRLAGLLQIPAEERSARVAEATADAAAAVKHAEAHGLDVLVRSDPEYPQRLGTIPDPPLALWTAGGDRSVLARPAVAVVGSRRASTIGLEIARTLGAGLARAGLVVVSGLARGIDGAAHRGALEGGGDTVAVLGSGADVPYPPQHRDLAGEIASRGLIVSELPPGTPPYASHFPLRNRIISGLSLAIVVVEASERSGSLITARLALEQGREVLAVPGNALAGTYRGCHALIKDGAGLVETVEDVLEAIGWEPRRHPTGNETSKVLSSSHLALQMPLGDPVSADELAERTGRPVTEWLAELGMLEIAGVVTRTASGLFVRLDGPATNRER